MRKIGILTGILIAAVACDLFNNNPDPDSDNSSDEHHDIAIHEINVPDFIVTGSEASIEVILENQGNSILNDTITVSVLDKTDSVSVGSQEVSGITRNDTTVLSFLWNTEGFSNGEHTLTISHNYEDNVEENNSETVEVMINERAEFDVAISQINAANFVTQGNTLEVEVVVRNSGFEDITGTIGITLYDETDDITIRTQSINGLNRDEEKAVVFDWETSSSSLGEHTLRVSHNYSDNNQADNARTFAVSVNEQVESDIAIAHVSTADTVIIGTEVDVEVLVQNPGEADITESFTVTLNDESSGSTIGSQSIQSLSSGEETTLTYTWQTRNATAGDYSITASHNFDDDNSGNNSQSTTTYLRDAILDIAIGKIEAPENVPEGDIATIEVEVLNLGDLDVTESITVRFTHHGAQEGQQTIDNGLTAGSSTLLIFNWDTEGEQTGSPPHPLVFQHFFEDDFMENNSDSTRIQVDEL